MSELLLGDNYIRYENVSLKISNITRTWIFKVPNIEKEFYEQEKRNYIICKKKYDENKLRQKKEVINCIILAVLFMMMAIFWFFISDNTLLTSLCLVFSLCFFAFAVIKKKEKFICPNAPIEKKYYEKLALGIEMNSGHKEVFASDSENAIDNLKTLQKYIDEAEKLGNNIETINMNSYNVSHYDINNILNNEFIQNNVGDFSTGKNNTGNFNTGNWYNKI